MCSVSVRDGVASMKLRRLKIEDISDVMRIDTVHGIGQLERKDG